MPPEFPDFAALTPANLAVLGEMARRFSPYSEFSPASLRAWTLAPDRQIARLGGNLVLILASPDRRSRFLCLLGDHDLAAAASRVLAAAPSLGLAAELRQVPEEVAALLPGDAFAIVEDRGQFDYVLDIGQLVDFKGNALKHKRQRINKFTAHLAANGGGEIVPLDVGSKAHRDEILAVSQVWAGRKSASFLSGSQAAMIEAEFEAIHRLLLPAPIGFDDGPGLDLEGTLIRVGGELAGFAIAEVVHAGFGMMHFAKALGAEHPGITETLLQQTARRLRERGCTHLNFQEDLGLEGLREAKLRYRPVGFLKKYTVGPKGSSPC